MRKLYLLSILLCLLSPGWCDAKADAVAKGQAFLAQLDKGEYAKAYQGASKFMKGQVDATKFKQGISAAKARVGARKSRKFQGSQATTALPGAKGDFHVLTWSSSFANLPQAREVIVVSFEEGQWKLAGYSIVR